MKVLVLGYVASHSPTLIVREVDIGFRFRASGFVGLPVAQALVRAGHIVHGLTRSKAKAVHLVTEEGTSWYIYPFLRFA
jgi:hypothetical protein